MVDALALGASEETRVGSSPTLGTKTTIIMIEERHEEVVLEIRPALVVLLYYLVPIILADIGLAIIFSTIEKYYLLVIVGIFILGLFVATVLVLNWYLTIYRLTTKRVESRNGILGVREEEISLDDVQHVDIRRTFPGVLLNYGTVIVHAAGTNANVELTNISNPKTVANKIEDLAIELELAREKKGDKIVEK